MNKYITKIATLAITLLSPLSIASDIVKHIDFSIGDLHPKGVVILQDRTILFADNSANKDQKQEGGVWELQKETGKYKELLRTKDLANIYSVTKSQWNRTSNTSYACVGEKIGETTKYKIVEITATTESANISRSWDMSNASCNKIKFISLYNLIIGNFYSKMDPEDIAIMELDTSKQSNAINVFAKYGDLNYSKSFNKHGIVGLAGINISDPTSGKRDNNVVMSYISRDSMGVEQVNGLRGMTHESSKMAIHVADVKKSEAPGHDTILVAIAAAPNLKNVMKSKVYGLYSDVKSELYKTTSKTCKLYKMDINIWAFRINRVLMKDLNPTKQDIYCDAIDDMYSSDFRKAGMYVVFSKAKDTSFPIDYIDITI